LSPHQTPDYLPWVTLPLGWSQALSTQQQAGQCWCLGTLLSARRGGKGMLPGGGGGLDTPQGTREQRVPPETA